MEGAVEVEELPYNYVYRRCPYGFEARTIPVYNQSFPGYWSGDKLMYGGNAVPMFIVDAPYKDDDNSLVRKRKLDDLKGKQISSGGQRVTRNILVENRSKANEGASPSKPMHSPAVSSSNHATTPPEWFRANATDSKHSSVSSVKKNAAYPRVISIPVTFTDDKDNMIQCMVIPPEGTKKTRKAMSEEAAAVLIQSWFRGYQVRKTNPLPQLRLIAKVKLQLKELDDKISDTDYINYIRENPVAMVKLTEGIMKLLFELDTIQGAQPAVREVRKGATKEVVSLQERVDEVLSAEMANMESSHLPVNIEEKSRDVMDPEKLATIESRANDSVAATLINADMEESYFTSCAEPDPYQEKSEVRTVEGIPEQMEFEACKVDDVRFNRSIGSLSTQMVESDGNGVISQVLSDDDNLEVMESKESKADLSEINERVAAETDSVSQLDQPAEGQVQNESSVENESLSDSHHEADGELVTVSLDRAKRTSEAGEMTTVGADEVRMVAIAERFVESGNVCDLWGPTSEKQGEREPVDDKVVDHGLRTAGDLKKPCGYKINLSNAKGECSLIDSSLPYSPTSPFEAVNCLDFQPSVSDRELESDLQKSSEIIQDTSAQSEADCKALLLKLSQENKALKSLLVTVMKWNQTQAMAMQDVNHRLRKLESRMGKKKSSSRRKVDKSSLMLL